MQEKQVSTQIITAPEEYRFTERNTLSRRAFGLSLGLLLLIIVLLSWLVNWSLDSRYQELRNGLEKRLELLASSKADVISTWLSGLTGQGDRVIQSDLFRLYAKEIDLIENDLAILLTSSLDHPPEGVSEDMIQLAAQLPMMQNLLKEFTGYSGFINSRIVNRSGRSYIATDAITSPLTGKQIQLVKQVLAENRPLFSPTFQASTGLTMQIYLPILSPPTRTKEQITVAVLILNKAVSDKINELLAASPLGAEGERLRLLQRSGEDYMELTPWLPGEFAAIQPPPKFNEQAGISFGRRPSLDGQKEVFAIGIKVPGINWWVIQEVEAKSALAPFYDFRRLAISLAGLVGLVFALSFWAFWWRLIGVENRKQAAIFCELARQIEEQRQLLDGINGNLTEYIGLKDNNGTYKYVNPAFATAIGRPGKEILGLDDAALFGYDTAKRLENSDNQVVKNRQPLSINEKIYLKSKLHHLQISKAPFLDQHGQPQGIISAYRDVTELVGIQQKKDAAVRQTIEALVKTIEQRDPYLSGHSRLMSAFSILVAKNLHASELDVATVETAAYLSQIGKVFIDQGLLSKPGKLTKEEKKAVEKHVEHAANILKGIDFELPVYDGICQMNELLDGSGYPHGLSGEEICLPAKIMGVVNSFCAMVKPRSYRPAISVKETLEILGQAQSKYDKNILEALRFAVASREGERLLLSSVDLHKIQG